MGRQHEVDHAVDTEVSNILINLGIPVNLQGFKYLKHCIKHAISSPGLMHRVTKQLYPTVAVECDVTEARVERAIRHAILVAYNRHKIINLNKVFNLSIFLDYEKPTNSELIALIADRMITKHHLVGKG